MPNGYRRTTVVFAVGLVGVATTLVGGCAIQVSDATAPTSTTTSGATVTPSASPGKKKYSVPFRWDPKAGGKVIYLTFDDGPSQYTPEVLKILKDNGARATFFQIGRNVPSDAAIEKRIIEQGNAIGNHTWDHSALGKLTAEQQAQQLTRTRDQIGADQGPCMRAPYGSMNNKTRPTAASLGMTPVLWSLDTFDWQGKSAVSIEATLAKAKGGDVVLMHDGGGNRAPTVAALSAALPKLKDQGYVFEPVPVCVKK
jgi:peptidoglycan-N-acetylglucosamine deacetylase